MADQERGRKKESALGWAKDQDTALLATFGKKKNFEIEKTLRRSP